MNPAIELTLNQAFDFLLHVAVVRPVFLWGAPGIGKTALVNRFAATVGLECVALLYNLRLATQVDDQWRLTVAGLLMFGVAPQRFMPQSRLSAVAFAGVDEDALSRREPDFALVGEELRVRIWAKEA